MAVKVALVMAALAALGCQRRSRDGSGAQDRTAAAGATRVSGALTHRGQTYSLGDQVEVRATRCQGSPTVTVSVGVRAIELLRITGDTTLVEPGVALAVQTAGDGFDFERDKRAHAVATLPAETLPARAELRFDQLTREGAVDVRFDLDFGALGHAEGRVAVPASQQLVCVTTKPPG